MLKKSFVAMCLSAVAFAESARKPITVVRPPPPAILAASDATTAILSEPPKGASRGYVGVHGALNLGAVAVDGMVNRFYGFVAGNVGLPVLSSGRRGALSAGFGYSFPISQVAESMWFLDLMGVAPFGWLNDVYSGPFGSRTTTWGYAGAGIAVGFRYLHRSGFSLGIKIPTFGFVFGDFGTPFDVASSIGTFYAYSALGLPVLSLGYRF